MLQEEARITAFPCPFLAKPFLYLFIYFTYIWRENRNAVQYMLQRSLSRA